MHDKHERSRNRAHSPRRTDETEVSSGPAGLQAQLGNAAVARIAAAQHRETGACAHCAPVQRSAVPGVLSRPGTAMDESLRTEMEDRFGGADFSSVRLHTSSAAHDAADEVQARAFTTGENIVLSRDVTPADKHTMAHELTHVLQQREGPVAGTDNGSGLNVSDPSDRFEREAETTAGSVMSRAPVRQDGARREHSAAGGSPAEPALQRVTRHTVGDTKRDPDSDNYDSEGSDFDTHHRPNLTDPTTEDRVAALVEAGSNEEVVLWRGTTLAAAEAMNTNGSAGGGSADASAAAPDREAAQQQVARGGQGPEFTTQDDLGFSRGHALVVVRIQARFLTRGSRSENGWVAAPAAPLTVLHIVDRTRGRQEQSGPNAS